MLSNEKRHVCDLNMLARTQQDEIFCFCLASTSQQYDSEEEDVGRK